MIYDVLGWFAAAIVSMKILLQRIWKERVEWDDPVPKAIQQCWHQWRSELPSLANKCVPCCYFPNDARIASIQIHGF